MDSADFTKICEYNFFEERSQRYTVGVTNITDKKEGSSKTYVQFSRWWFDLTGDQQWHPTKKHFFIPVEAWNEFRENYEQELSDVVQRNLNGASNARPSIKVDTADGGGKVYGKGKAGGNARVGNKRTIGSRGANSSEAPVAKVQRKNEKGGGKQQGKPVGGRKPVARAQPASDSDYDDDAVDDAREDHLVDSGIAVDSERAGTE